MKSIPKNTEAFREDLRKVMSESGKSQRDLETGYGVSQAILSNFISGNRGISSDSMLKLWPFVYGCDFTPAIPATQRGGSDAA